LQGAQNNAQFLIDFRSKYPFLGVTPWLVKTTT
jgi:hypothetical protein